ncbi:MAG: hypothetical protein ACSHX0_13495 [Akkermansiaceae bacterium]
MRRPKIGDIVEVPTQLGLFYGLITHWNNQGDVTRFDPTPYKAPLSNFSDLFNFDKELMTKLCTFVGPLESGSEIKVIAKTEIPKKLQPFPLFRSGTPHHETQKVNIWWIWDGKEAIRVGDLNEEQMKLPRDGAYNNAGLIFDLEGKTHPSLL